jgi:hypothetical protein
VVEITADRETQLVGDLLDEPPEIIICTNCVPWRFLFHALLR